MTDGLDIVAVGIEHEGSVVIGVVVGTQAGRAVVLAARSDRRAVEGIDRCAGERSESDVDMPAAQAFSLADPEKGLEIRTETDRGAMTRLLG